VLISRCDGWVCFDEHINLKSGIMADSCHQRSASASSFCHIVNTEAVTSVSLNPWNAFGTLRFGDEPTLKITVFFRLPVLCCERSWWQPLPFSSDNGPYSSKDGGTELVLWPGTDSPSPNLQSAAPSVLDCSRLFVLRTFMADKILRSVKRY